MESLPDAPRITAVVCTADRGEPLVRTARSILANNYPCFELIIVDQSEDILTATALAPLRSDVRMRYIRSPVRGKGRALNLGLAEARSEMVACTDDDCVVPEDWLERMSAAFDRWPEAAVVFGAVAAAPHDPTKGFVPAYEPQGERLVSSVVEHAGLRGMGACMGVRHSAIAKLGGFDPAFGPGGSFPSCDDWDIALRALRAGFAICETDSVTVTHYGFRTFGEGRELVRRDWYAIGGLCAKLVRSGERRLFMAALAFFLARGLWPPIADLLHFRRPVGLTRLRAFYRGLRNGLPIPLRPDSLVFDLNTSIGSLTDASSD